MIFLNCVKDENIINICSKVSTIDASKNVIKALAPDNSFDGIGIQNEIPAKYLPTLDVAGTEIISVAEKIALLHVINLVTFNYFSSDR